MTKYWVQQRSKGTTEGTSGLGHRTVRCTPDNVRCARGLQLKLVAFGNFQRHFAIIHRTVRCSKEERPQELASLGKLLRYNSPDCPVYTRLSGEPAEQRLFRRQRLPATHLLRASARRCQARPYWRTRHSTVHVRCATGLPGGPRRQSSNGRIPKGLVTWLAHRTCHVYTGLSGAPYDSQPHKTASLVVGAINTPNHPPFIASKFSTSQPLTRARHSILDTPKRSNPLQFHTSL
jgi:hypothetical protein